MGGVGGKETQISEPKIVDSDLDSKVGDQKPLERVALTRSTNQMRFHNSKGLPDEVILLILNQLREEDLISLALLCKTWRRIVHLITFHEITLDANSYHKLVPLIQKGKVSINRNFGVYYHEVFARKDEKNGNFILNAFKNNRISITSFSIKVGMEVSVLSGVQNTTLTNFIVNDDSIGDTIGTTPLLRFLKSHPTVTSLTLPGTKPIESELFEYLKTSPIQKLTVLGGKGMGPSNCVHPDYLELANLTCLFLKRVAFPPLGTILASLKKNTTLQELTIADCYMDDATCKALIQTLLTNTTLHTLDLSMNVINIAAVDVFRWLELNSSLKVLSLSTNSIDEATAALLVPLLKKK